MKYITGIKLDANWRRTTEQFLLHFREQFRLLDDLIDPKERMVERMRCILLENAVQDIPFLRNINNTDEFQRILHRSNKFNYKQYFNLLLVAAQKYDSTSKVKPNNARRIVYNHEMDSEGFNDVFDTQEGTQYEGIDLPTDELYHVNRSSWQDPCPDVSNEVYSMFKTGQFRKPDQQKRPPNRSNIPPEGYVKLPKGLWTVILDNFRQQVYNYNDSLPLEGYKGNPTTQRQVHLQESLPPEDTDYLPTPHDEPPDDNPFMDMVNEQLQLTPDNVPHILSVNKSKRSEKVKHPITRSANTHVTYTFARSNTSPHLQLVDRGANGGLSGADMKVLNKTGRKVNISGIDKHELTGLDIIACASMYETNQGHIIGVFHEYAFYGQGRSIHSPAQMEWFKTNVDNKSKAIGGKQRLVALEGYIIAFEVSSGIVYMKPLGLPRDDDMDKYPHVFMTNPHEWDPCVMDYKYHSRKEWETLGHVVPMCRICLLASQHGSIPSTRWYPTFASSNGPNHGHQCGTLLHFQSAYHLCYA
jgi:hypothetical protein